MINESHLIIVIDYLGTFVFAISGALAATEKRFDLFGVLMLALVTAIGGGTLRDLLIGSTPVGWMTNEVYIYLIISAVPIVYIFNKHIHKLRRSFFLFDTLGIGLFTILGLEKTLSAGLSPLIGIMMGVTSAVFGGVIRDVLSNEVPLIFRKEIYASACFVGALIYVGMEAFAPESVAVVLSILSVIIIRILAVRKQWSLNIRPKQRND